MINKKIFVIGFNKTGTTSICRVFNSVGINAYHGVENVLNIIDLYDAFTDGTHSDFKTYYDIHPNGLFILNTRPLRKWLVSRYKHGACKNFRDSWCWPVTDERTKSWINQRESHFSNVLSFFKDKKESFLIVNIERRGWEERIINFIGKRYRKKTRGDFHLNKRLDINFDSKKLYEINKNVDDCLKENNYTGEELLPSDVDLSLYNSFI